MKVIRELGTVAESPTNEPINESRLMPVGWKPPTVALNHPIAQA